MKVFILAAFFVGYVSCGDFMLESTADMFAKWSKFKAMETCFGDEVTRNFLLKLKKAHAKCASVELPVEAQLEVQQSSTKLVKALLDGSAHVERETIAKLKDALGFPKSQAGFQSFGGAFPYPVPFPVASFQQQAAKDEDSDFMSDLMKKMFMKKMMKKFLEKKSADKTSTDAEGEKEESDDEEDLAELLFTKGPFSKMMSNKKRTRRDDEDEEDAAPKPDLYDLGDRLTAKLVEEKKAWAAKLSNYSCILQELKIVDKDLELNLDGFLEDVKNSGIKDQWLLDTIVEDKKKCYAKAQALPQEVLEGCILGPKWVKVKEFMCCCKQAKMRTCMAHDTKQKLEANFGPVDKILSQTGLKEKELLAMAAKLVFGSMDLD